MKPFVFALAALNLADSISFMIVTPSLAFYISSLGGSQDFYGFVLAIYSFTSFCGNPVLGRWSDAYNFKVPYMVSITVSVLGGFLYAIAPAFPKRTTALSVVALGRILGGFGRSNSALGFAYVARALTGNERTSTMALLGGVQMIGMAIAPLFSACLSGVDFSLWGVHFDYLNSVGLIMVIINLASQVVVYFLLPDLPMFTDNGKADEEKESEWLRMFRCILRNPHIGVPFLTIFTFNFNWQFIETSLAPASFDALGWSPIEVSYVLGAMAVVIFLGMTTVHKLSQSGVSNFSMLIWGLLANTIGYMLLYIFWQRGVHPILFVGPVLVAGGSYAFIGAPNRCLFSEAVDSTAELVGFEGTMQALLSMASSIGGFTAPGIIVHYCLRTPDEVSLSNNGREFMLTALFSPALSLCVFIATFVVGDPLEKMDAIDTSDEERPDETTPLTENKLHPRDSEGDEQSRMGTFEQPQRRRSILETARRASIRGSMTTAMTIIPQDDDIYE